MRGHPPLPAWLDSLASPLSAVLRPLVFIIPEARALGPGARREGIRGLLPLGGGCEGGKSASWALPSTGLPAPVLMSLPRPLSSRSYVFSSLATSAVSFATGALGMWIPLYLHRAQVVQKTAETCSSPPCGAKDRWGRARGLVPGAGRGWVVRDAVSPHTPALPPNCPLSLQPHLWGHHLLHGFSGRGHGGGSHTLVPPADPEG